VTGKYGPMAAPRANTSKYETWFETTTVAVVAA
jgi:hypothetical protein